MLAFRSLDPFRALREPDPRRRDEKRPFPLRTKNCQHNPNNRLTGKAPYKFESISLQRRVRCEPAANRPRRGHAAGSNTFQCRAATGPVLRDRIAVAPADCTQGVSATANFGLRV